MAGTNSIRPISPAVGSYTSGRTARGRCQLTEPSGKTAAALQEAVEIARLAGMNDVADRLAEIAKKLRPVNNRSTDVLASDRLG